MTLLDRKLDVVFFETVEPARPGQRRFVARDLECGGWGVYDRHRQRFLEQRDIDAMSEEDLRANMPH